MNLPAAYMPFVIPVAIIEIVLALTALIHVLRHKEYRFGNRLFWVIVVLVAGYVGPVVYFTVGKGDD